VFNPLRAAFSTALDVYNPLRGPINRGLDATLRSPKIPGVQFTDPPGDPGWFGPGSATWYVHSHSFCQMIGYLAAARMEALHPDFAWMAPVHSKTFTRDENRQPTYEFDSTERMMERAARSVSFFEGVSFGSSEAATSATRSVAAMHHRVKGVRPDGKPYDADDPLTLRWAYCTVVWGFAAAHERYHPKPLKDIDAYYGEWVKVGEALGGTELPATKAEVLALFEELIPVYGLTSMAIKLATLRIAPTALTPAAGLMDWAIYDLQPWWAQQLYGQPRTNRLQTLARRQLLRTTIDLAEIAKGPGPEYVQACARAAAAPAAAERDLVMAA
jgi:uncharacterized protein (DUF2236 family)